MSLGVADVERVTGRKVEVLGKRRLLRVIFRFVSVGSAVGGGGWQLLMLCEDRMVEEWHGA